VNLTARLGPRLAIALCFACAVPGVAQAQMTLEEAREEGKAMGNAARANPDLRPSTEAQAEAVPGYAGTTTPQGTYFDDPDQLINDAQALKHGNEGYSVTTDSAGSRPAFSNAEILGATRRASDIEADPTLYLEGETYSGSSGTCTPLPAGAGTDGYYEATCNRGAKLEPQPRSCRITMVPESTTVSAYKYYAEVPFHTGMAPAISEFAGALADGTCTNLGTADTCQVVRDYGSTPIRNCDRYRFDILQCTRPIPGLTGTTYPATGQIWFEQASATTVTTRRVDSCGALASDVACTPASAGETCVEPGETRIIDGVAVTEACWSWQRDFTCHTVTQGNDCGTLEASGQCTFLREECLDDPAVSGGGACQTSERVYRCPTPGGVSPDTPQYICGDDVYCINGDCEPIVREASTEFKDALVALHAIDQAGKEFDESTYRVFSGTRETCHKPVFGLVNCCAGKVSGAVPVAAGAAALAGGPAAIAAFATPFLVLFSCSQDEMRLDIQDRMGFCHKVGTYCSSSVLGICSTKRTAYCCFESKLSRILQEQGRVQLGKPWGEPKREQCIGFSIEEFSRLDLSVMDFTEVYSDFVDAAKLPDEVETMTDIQRKIEDYYELHGS
jgi:conjugal transfer mating pair stabilization protein TraN